MSSKTQGNGSVAVPAEEQEVARIVVERVRRDRLQVPIVGISPLIPHRWSEKARRQMFEKQSGKASAKKPPKDPSADAAAATYWLPDGRPGMPVTAFMAAIADAARYFDKLTIEMLKRVVTDIHGELGDDEIPLVPISGELKMRTDMPRNANGVADLRYRNQIWPWSAILEIEFLSSMISPEALVNIVDASGNGGVGDWRPSSPKSKSGTFGRYEVAS